MFTRQNNPNGWQNRHCPIDINLKAFHHKDTKFTKKNQSKIVISHYVQDLILSGFKSPTGITLLPTFNVAPTKTFVPFVSSW
jgi:hypothetical protein